MEDQVLEGDDKQEINKKLSICFIDKDEKENPKFNDARLIDILRNYPLLYNKSLETYDDPDYAEWMWGEIANEMNELHTKTSLNAPFSWTDCRDKWEMVKRALHYLSNPAAKNFRYPKHFKECLEFFQNYIKDRREKTKFDRFQDLFLCNANFIEKLSHEKQLALEKEVLETILSHELEFCAPMIDPSGCENKAQEEFNKVIGLLMPEVDFQVVRNELGIECDTFNTENVVGTNDNQNIIITEPVTDVNQLLNLCGKSGISLKRAGSHYELDNLIQIPSKRVEILLSQPTIQYSIEVPAENSNNIVQNIIEENVIEEHVAPEVPVQEDGAQEVVLQECVFEEDIIEEVVPQGAGKDMPTLDIDGSFESQVNRLDFSLF